ncbi:DMT family transporter [Pseudonocardia sp.]|uniref:DMT family transporter n=1 Tax=Pseudonocardia sp. TaxID=60912 RepID=UPI003D111B6B
MIAAGLALLAALLFAIASAVQQNTAAEVPDDVAGGLGLIRVLVRRPWWWIGTLSDVGGYVAQAAALAVGSLVLVQPLLVTTLLFALPLGARWSGRALRPADRAWAVLLAASLAVFVAVGEPTAGADRAPLEAWLPTAAVLGAVLVACLVGAAVSKRQRRGTVRAFLLAVATGVLYGITAALTKGVVTELDGGILRLLATWETYALAVVAVSGTLLQQSAFQAGDLAASLPAITVGEPVVGVAIGLTVLGEQLQADGVEWLVIALAVGLAVTATVALARATAREAAPSGEGLHAG